MKHMKKLNQTGDTIIEVMMVLAILSMSFGISYATANRGLGQSLNAEQHSEALGLLEGQVEQLRSAVSSGQTPPNGYFCMVGTTPTSLPGSFTSQDATSDIVDSQGGYTEYGHVCQLSSNYYVSITEAFPVNSNGATYSYKTPVPCVSGTCSESSFTFMIRWDGTGTQGPQQESLTYRIGSSELGYQPPQSVSTTPLPVTIDGDSDASCTSPGEYCTSDDPSPAVGSDWVFSANYNVTSIPSDNNGYMFTVYYSNMTNPGLNPPPSYSYNVIFTINGTYTKTLNLPDDPSSNTTVLSDTIALPTSIKSISTITASWNNDDYNPPLYDANFDLNYMVAQGN